MKRGLINTSVWPKKKKKKKGWANEAEKWRTEIAGERGGGEQPSALQEVI